MTMPPRHSRHLPAFILLTLAERPLHGNGIRAALTARMPDFKVDPGAVYRTLSGLEQDGQVSARWDTETPGPARKVYELTRTGWDRLDFWEEDIRHRMGFLSTFLQTLEQVRKGRG